MLSANALRDIAEFYFRGSSSFLMNEFTHSPEFLDGQKRGHEDAYAICQGIADYLDEEVKR